jgi:acetyltransferase-like isoleucine patch superfamily enzyme
MLKSLLRDFQSSMQRRGWQGPAGALRLASHYILRSWLLNILVSLAPYGMTIPMHRARGATIGDGCFIDPSAILETGHANRISIGDDVRIGARVVIMTHILPGYHLREMGAVDTVLSDVVIEDHAFIGVNVVIMPGVRVGRGAVVVSGSVVFNSVAPYTVVTGNPARKIKTLEPTQVDEGHRTDHGTQLAGTRTGSNGS